MTPRPYRTLTPVPTTRRTTDSRIGIGPVGQSVRVWIGPACCAWLLMIVAAGCGKRSELEKVVVSGEVTYQGEPVADGDIRFEPMPGTDGPLSGAAIRDGKYVAKGRGGVPVGEHLVRIRAFRTAAGGGDMLSMQGNAATDGGQYLPEKYNRSSQETVTIAGDQSKVTLDFHLE